MNSIRFNWLLARYKYSHKAAEELYETYYPMIVCYINRQFRGRIDGRDVAQQFFLKLFELKAYNIRAPNAWVHTVARNLAIDILRKEESQKAIETFELAEESYVPDDISEILSCLNDSEKKIIYLHYWERYRLTEIAVMTKMKYDAVKYFHSTAKKKLRNEYKTYEKVTDH